jgi:hypothetical protein
MNLKDRITAFENDARILERIASQYNETSMEHVALKRAAIALWYVFHELRGVHRLCRRDGSGSEPRTAVESAGNRNRPGS